MKTALGGLALAATGAALFVASVGRAQDAPGSTPAATNTNADGKRVYEEICQACHMADAKGGGGAGASIPALAGNPKLADPDYGVQMLLKGRGGMPWFTEMLTPAQMAAVLTYVRSHFNAYPDPITEARVKQQLGAMPKRECETCGS